MEPPDAVKGRSKTAEATDRDSVESPKQERLILAAWEAGLEPAATAREFRRSRLAVEHAITGAQRGRRNTER